jgi:predicted transcriptional regulator of viral defense system
MKRANELPLLLMTHSESLKSIYTRSDLAHLFGVQQSATLAKRIETLIQAGFLNRAQNGYYFIEGARLEDLAQRIFQDGYLSLHGVLSRYGMCGTKINGQVDIITNRARPKKIITSIGVIQMHVQKKYLHFGYTFNNGLNMATPEKCFVDLCYFHQKSPVTHLNLYGDLFLAELSKSKLEDILKYYKNQKFLSFVRAVIDSYGL